MVVQNLEWQSKLVEFKGFQGIFTGSEISEVEQIVFLERNTFRVDFRRPDFPHSWNDYGETSPDQIVERARDASIVVCNKLVLGEPELSQLPSLKLIAVAATGVDNIDLFYCRNNGIAVCNARNYAEHSLPEHVLMLMLALRRNLIPYREDVARGAWQKANQFTLLDHPIHDLYGCSLGIVGYGSLGQAVARIAKAIGMKVRVSERKSAMVVREERIAFSELLKQSDVISLHCPLNDETKNLIAAEEFQLMKPDAILINTARGGLIDEQALVHALKNGIIAGAAIDVLRKEPPREESILLNLNILNLIVTPHIAWASREAMQMLADQLIDIIEAFVSGSPKNLVT